MNRVLNLGELHSIKGDGCGLISRVFSLARFKGGVFVGKAGYDIGRAIPVGDIRRTNDLPVAGGCRRHRSVIGRARTRSGVVLRDLQPILDAARCGGPFIGDLEPQPPQRIFGKEGKKGIFSIHKGGPSHGIGSNARRGNWGDSTQGGSVDFDADTTDTATATAASSRGSGYGGSPGAARNRKGRTVCEVVRVDQDTAAGAGTGGTERVCCTSTDGTRSAVGADGAAVCNRIRGHKDNTAAGAAILPITSCLIGITAAAAARAKVKPGQAIMPVVSTSTTAGTTAIGIEQTGAPTGSRAGSHRSRGATHSVEARASSVTWISRCAAVAACTIGGRAAAATGKITCCSTGPTRAICGVIIRGTTTTAAAPTIAATSSSATGVSGVASSFASATATTTPGTRCIGTTIIVSARSPTTGPGRAVTTATTNRSVKGFTVGAAGGRDSRAGTPPVP